MPTIPAPPFPTLDVLSEHPSHVWQARPRVDVAVHSWSNVAGQRLYEVCENDRSTHAPFLSYAAARRWAKHVIANRGQTRDVGVYDLDTGVLYVVREL